MNKWIILLPMVLISLMFSCTRPAGMQTTPPILAFDSEGLFKIAQFTDVHWNPTSPHNAQTKAVIQHILQTEQPDLAMVTGDVVTAQPGIEGWQSIAQIFVDAKTPWALTLGNHDDEAGMTRAEIMELLVGTPYFVGEAGPPIGGSGNYVLPIRGYEGDEVEALLYCLDTHNRPPAHKYGRYDWVHFDQVNWYREQSRIYNHEKSGFLPALAFFHIPIKEFEEVHRQPNIVGTADEDVASSDINSGLFASFLEMGDVMGAFVGHDHSNDYIGTHYDIALAYGRTTGADAYGDLPRGGRIIVLHEGERYFDTWIRTPEGVAHVYYYPAGRTAEEENHTDYLPARARTSSKAGLHYRYYEGGQLKQLADTAQATLVRSGTTARITLDIADARDSFALVFKGMINIPKRDVYRFYTYSDDGSKLSIGGRLVVDNDNSHSARRRDGQIALDAGLHEFELAYFDNYMGEVLEVGYSSGSIPEQVLREPLFFMPADD